MIRELLKYVALRRGNSRVLLALGRIAHAYDVDLESLGLRAAHGDFCREGLPILAAAKHFFCLQIDQGIARRSSKRIQRHIRYEIGEQTANRLLLRVPEDSLAGRVEREHDTPLVDHHNHILDMVENDLQM